MNKQQNIGNQNFENFVHTITQSLNYRISYHTNQITYCCLFIRVHNTCVVCSCAYRAFSTKLLNSRVNNFSRHKRSLKIIQYFFSIYLYFISGCKIFLIFNTLFQTSIWIIYLNNYEWKHHELCKTSRQPSN